MNEPKDNNTYCIVFCLGTKYFRKFLDQNKIKIPFPHFPTCGKEMESFYSRLSQLFLVAPQESGKEIRLHTTMRSQRGRRKLAQKTF